MRRRWFHRFKSAITGRYVTKDEARAHPESTFEERQPKPDLLGPIDEERGPVLDPVEQARLIEDLREGRLDPPA